ATNRRWSVLPVPDLTADFSGVPRGAFGPLLGQIVHREVTRYRANRHARPAIDALYRVYVEHLFGGVPGIILLGVDAIHRGGVHARRVLRSDAGFCYDICHLIFILSDACLIVPAGTLEATL